MHSQVLHNPIRFIIPLLCLLRLACAPQAAGALDTDKTLAQCRLDIWTPKDGLPDAINAMAQTPDGYLWLATGAGLVRFDGVTFRTFSSRNTPSLKHDGITALMVTRQGKLWIGTDGAGFGPFENRKFTPLRTGLNDESWSVTTSLLEARDGSVWIGGHGEHNLLHYDQGRFQKLPADRFVQCVLEDRRGTVWAATRTGGLLAHRTDGTRFTVNRAQGLPAEALSCIVLDSDNSLWIGTMGGGLCHYREGKCTTYTTRNGLSSNEINTLSFDHQGNLWIGTRVGLDRRQGGKFSTFRKADGLYDVGVSALFEDREGALWAGSGTGLNRFCNTNLTPLSFATAEGPARMFALAEGPDGSLWFGTDRGLKRLHNGVITTYTTREGLPSNTIHALHVAKDGVLWIITPHGGITTWKGNRFTTLFPKTPWRIIGEDREGIVFADRDDYARLLRGKFVLMSHSGQSSYVFNSYLAADGTLWFASFGGLASVRHNHVSVLTQGLPVGAHVTSIAQAGAGCLWVGTDKGLVRYENGAGFVYGTASGLPDDNLSEVLIDAHGALWIGGSCGIFTVSITDLERYRLGALKTVPTRLYDVADGIRCSPTRMQALRIHDNRLMFVGGKGATLVDPDRLAIDFVPPPVVIERVIIDKRAIDTQNIHRIRPGKGELEIHYTALDLSEAEKVSFRYRLEGYDKDWVDARSRRVAYYTNLPPGDYHFRVIAGNWDGIWNTTGADFEFKLYPFFYQTVPFKAACIVVLGLCGWALAHLSLLQLQRNNQRLEAKVSERTEELHRSKEQIEAVNRRLQELASTDGMTGLANHRAFQEQLRSELKIADTTGRPLALLLMDVDQFKTYNDTFGHPAGDEVLRSLARLIQENMRTEDYAARYGGEEFAILLPGTTERAAFEIAERIRGVVADYPFPCRRVTLSIGVARYDAPKMPPEKFVARADEALYTAKHAGRNRVALAADAATEADAVDSETPAASAALIHMGARDPLTSLLQRQGGHVLNGIMALLNLRDPETDGHSHRVTRYALRLAQEIICEDIADLSSDDLRDLTLGSLLHDIGKIGVPDAVLFKPGPLTEEEWAIIRAHPEQGVRVLEAFAQFVCALPVVRSHHERWDGTGYPNGLAGASIPLAARIFALADTLDAMSSDRPYRAALPYAAICAEVSRMAGKQFDPTLVQAFLAIPEAEWEKLRDLSSELDFAVRSL